MNRSHEFARDLFQKAREDARAMLVLVQSAEPADWIVGFHAQQAVEKAIKAVLANRSVEYPMTHNLSVLLDQLADLSLPLPPDAGDIPALTPFGAVLRYTTAKTPAVPDSGQATLLVERTLHWAASLLGLPPEGI
jgi:HEPN domain-containing protein